MLGLVGFDPSCDTSISDLVQLPTGECTRLRTLNQGAAEIAHYGKFLPAENRCAEFAFGTFEAVWSRYLAAFVDRSPPRTWRIQACPIHHVHSVNLSCLRLSGCHTRDRG